MLYGLHSPLSSVHHFVLVTLGERFGYTSASPVWVSIRNLFRFFFRSPVPNSKRNTKFHVQGRAKSERKRLILDSEYCSVYAACFHAQRCMRLLPICWLRSRINYITLGGLLGIPVEHDRSSEQVNSFSILSANPVIASGVHDQETDSRRIMEPLENIKSTTIPRLGGKWNVNLVCSRPWKESN